MNKSLVLITALIIITSSIVGCLADDSSSNVIQEENIVDEPNTEPPIDEISGCMDSEAINYGENVTIEITEYCIYPDPVLSVSSVIDDGSTIAIFGDVDHFHPDEITISLSADEDVIISTKPNIDGDWSLTMQSSAEHINLNITATHDLKETTSNVTFIEINRTTPEDGDDDTSQPQNYSILSAYHGLDELPAVASLLCGFNVAGDDGMPIVFSTQLQIDSVVPESFLVMRSDGESVVPNCATLHPADEPLEQRTVLLTGDFGTFGETPLRVEVTGPLLTFDGESLLGVSTEDITPLEDGPRVVLAERFAPDTNGLAGECPDGTTQVVQLTWQGGVTGPANAALGEDQRLGTLVLLEDGTTVNPLTLVDDDPDNHVLACLSEDSPAQWVVVHEGLFHDPGDIANPATHAEVVDGSPYYTHV